MPKTLLSPESTTIQLTDQLEYPTSGVLSKVLAKDHCCQYTLFCLAADTEISEHTATRNATVNVIAGYGTLTLEGREIRLEPGAFIWMPAHAPHALQAETNFAFLLTLSQPSAISA